MFSWLSNLFMSSTADAALEAAIYSVGLASNGGMHQIKVPESLHALAAEAWINKKHSTNPKEYKKELLL